MSGLPDLPQKEKRGWKAWALGALVVLLLVLVVQNAQKVQVDILFIHTTTPLIFALLLAGGLGGLIGWATPRVKRGAPPELPKSDD